MVVGGGGGWWWRRWWHRILQVGDLERVGVLFKGWHLFPSTGLNRRMLTGGGFNNSFFSIICTELALWNARSTGYRHCLTWSRVGEGGGRKGVGCCVSLQVFIKWHDLFSNPKSVVWAWGVCFQFYYFVLDFLFGLVWFDLYFVVCFSNRGLFSVSMKTMMMVIIIVIVLLLLLLLTIVILTLKGSRVFTISSLRHELSPTLKLRWSGRSRAQITCNTPCAHMAQRIVCSVVKLDIEVLGKIALKLQTRETRPLYLSISSKSTAFGTLKS